MIHKSVAKMCWLVVGLMDPDEASGTPFRVFCTDLVAVQNNTLSPLYQLHSFHKGLKLPLCNHLKFD